MHGDDRYLQDVAVEDDVHIIHIDLLEDAAHELLRGTLDMNADLFRLIHVLALEFLVIH